MYRSFFHYLMTLKNPDAHDAVSQFANNASFDLSFPKQLSDYQKLSSYLELNASYLPTMTIFDEAYEMYVASEQ